jgi:CO/xanthine dehydrogenase Mo-binding subunit
MLHCRLLTSPMPHARVRDIDASAALEMPGVVAILTADDVPSFPPPNNPILTNEPHFVGEPILAVAAEDETTAEDAIEKIKVRLEPRPFVVNPLDSLYPGGPDAREEGNIANVRLDLQKIKWTAKDFALAGDDKLPMGKPAEEWAYGDLEAGFRDAKLILEENFVTAGHSHHCMEPRSAMAYWQNGKCYLHGSSQSQTFMYYGLARYIGIKPQDLVFIAEYCGGGFGSKGAPYPVMTIPAHMSRKTGRPVLMRISRAEEYHLGSARPGFQGRVRMGFRADGRVTAVDVYVVHENGPNLGFWDFRNVGNAMSIVYQPLAMRWRGISVLTNTPPRGPQRGPGENQTAAAIEPIIDKAARELGLDRVAIRRINAPDNNGKYGADQGPLTSAYLKDALDKGAAEFNWQEKQKQSGQRRGSKVIGVGVGQAYHSAGAAGFDGLVRITPDGKLHIHSGVGNLGTYSYGATARVAAEVLNCRWENCVIERGDARKHLPWNLGQFGSNTSFTMTRSNYVAAMDAKQKLLEIAAMDLGGTADDYELGEERVVRKGDPATHLTYARAAQRAIELGGNQSGHQNVTQGRRWRRIDRCRQGHSGQKRRGAGTGRGFRANRVGYRNRPVRNPGLSGGGRLRHRAAPAKPGDTDQGRRRDGFRHGLRGTACLRSQAGNPGQHRLLPVQTTHLPGRAQQYEIGRRGHRGPAESGRITRRRRTDNGLRGRCADLCNFGCAGRPNFQSHAGRARHDHQRSGGPQPVAQTTASQHGVTGGQAWLTL